MRKLTLSEVTQKLFESEARRAALRDVLIQMLAIVAAHLPDEEAIFRAISNEAEKRVAELSPKTEAQVAISAWFQDEIDSIVGAAKTILTNAKKSN